MDLRVLIISANKICHIVFPGNEAAPNGILHFSLPVWFIRYPLLYGHLFTIQVNNPSPLQLDHEALAIDHYRLQTCALGQRVTFTAAYSDIALWSDAHAIHY